MPAALSAVLLSDCVTSAAPPPSLVARVVEAAADVAVGKTLASAASATVAALTEGAIKAMLMTKFKTVSVVLMGAAALAAIGIGTTSFPAIQARSTTQRDPVAEPKSAQQPAVKDDQAVGLVRQLGDPAFKNREDAVKKLRAFGVKAIPALQAGARDPDLEVSTRSHQVLAAVRADARDALAKRFDPKKTEEYDHSVWKRFVAIAGDSPASRELFARIIANEKWLRTLDNAEAGPAAAGHVYRVGIAEMFRDFDRDPAQMPEWPCNRGEEVAYLLLLGSYPDTPPAKLVGDEAVPTSLRNTTFFGRGIICGEGQIPHARGLALGLEGKLLDASKGINAPAVAGAAGTDRVFAKLFAAWFVRRDPGAEFVPLCFRIASMQRVPEILPFARRYAANDIEPKREVPPTATIAALELVAHLGTRADLPLFERHFGDETQVATEQEERDFLPLPPPITTQLRDVALGLALLLHGGNPEDFGFFVREGAFKQKAGRYEIPWYSHFQLGFPSEASRTATFKKAKAWLVEQKLTVEPPAVPNPGPEAE